MRQHEYQTFSEPIENASVVPNYREIKALEYREGDPQVRYYLQIPDDVNRNAPIQVDLGGRRMSVKLPDYVVPGEKVIIIAPKPVL